MERKGLEDKERKRPRRGRSRESSPSRVGSQQRKASGEALHGLSKSREGQQGDSSLPTRKSELKSLPRASGEGMIPAPIDEPSASSRGASHGMPSVGTRSGKAGKTKALPNSRATREVPIVPNIEVLLDERSQTLDDPGSSKEGPSLSKPTEKAIRQELIKQNRKIRNRVSAEKSRSRKRGEDREPPGTSRSMNQ